MKNSKLTQAELNVYESFEQCGKNAKKWMKKCVLMLPKIEELRIWEKKGFSTIHEFAAKLAGMSKHKVNEGLRILKRIDGMAEIRRVIEKKGIWAVKPVLRVLTAENQKFWAEKAMTMKRATLITYVRDWEKYYRNAGGLGEDRGSQIGDLQSGDSQSGDSQSGDSQGGDSQGGDSLPCDLSISSDNNSGRAGAGNPSNSALNKPSIFQKADFEKANSGDIGSQWTCSQNATFQKSLKVTVSMKLDPEVLVMLENLKGTTDWNTTIKNLLESHKREEQKLGAERQKLEDEKPPAVEANSRSIPVKIQKFIKARASGGCEAPGCKSPGKHFHHTTPFALKKEHDPDKIRLLCEAHHDIAHFGLIDNEDENPQKWRVREFPDLMDYKCVINARVAEFRRGGGGGGGGGGGADMAAVVGSEGGADMAAVVGSGGGRKKRPPVLRRPF